MADETFYSVCSHGVITYSFGAASHFPSLKGFIIDPPEAQPSSTKSRIANMSARLPRLPALLSQQRADGKLCDDNDRKSIPSAANS